jgi:small subunit ribosomal protein S8
MMIAHPVADMLTREAEGYIESYEIIPHDVQPDLSLKLKYRGERSHAKQAITTIKLVSKPGRRIYVGNDRIPRPLGGMGICILSTSQGVLAGHDAKERGIGGEILCEVL